MKITKTYGWNRRDFYYDAKCEFCDDIVKDRSGYDDDNYVNHVVPAMVCKKCGKSTLKDGKVEKTKTKYPKDLIL